MIDIIKKYIPEIISFTNINDSKIKTTLEKYNRRNDGFKELKDRNNTIIMPHSFFDWIILAHNGDIKALSFLKYIINQIQELLENIDPKFHGEIRKKITEMTFAIQTDVNQLRNPVHMNFVGEILGLNHILKFSKPRFRLEEIERKLTNCKKVDFVFRDADNKLIYIDFVSIHNIDITKLSTSMDLIEFLEGRFNQKLENKTPNLIENFHKIEDQGTYVSFAILPIIWTEISELLRFKDAFNTIDGKYANVFSCCSILPQELDDKSIIYDFCTVRHILDRWSKN